MSGRLGRGVSLLVLGLGLCGVPPSQPEKRLLRVCSLRQNLRQFERRFVELALELEGVRSGTSFRRIVKMGIVVLLTSEV